MEPPWAKIRFSTAATSRCAIHFRLGAMSNEKPTTSVSIPGVTNNTPPTSTNKLEATPSSGRRPSAKACCHDVNTFRPSRRARAAPSKPVTKMSNNVAGNPIKPPTLMNKANSMTGTTVNRRNSQRPMSVSVIPMAAKERPFCRDREERVYGADDAGGGAGASTSRSANKMATARATTETTTTTSRWRPAPSGRGERVPNIDRSGVTIESWPRAGLVCSIVFSNWAAQIPRQFATSTTAMRHCKKCRNRPAKRPSVL